MKMLSPNTQWVELIPAGMFRTNDGRGPFYNSDPQAVVRLSQQYIKMKGGSPIDCEHATDLAAPHGLPAPAMGWLRDYRVVAGVIQGRIEWTPRGAAALKAKEYRFISPVFSFDRPEGARADAMTGRVLLIRSAALTNNPALDQLPAIAASRLVELSAIEKRICSDLGNSEADYAAEKARRQALYGTRTAVTPATAATLDAIIERQLGPMLSELTALASGSGAGPAASEMSEEDRKLCWLTGMSPAALMASRENHHQTVLASR
jgi:phage I-like protein